MSTFSIPADLRRAARAGEFDAPTAGQCLGYVHTNLVIVPVDAADEFADLHGEPARELVSDAAREAWERWRAAPPRQACCKMLMRLMSFPENVFATISSATY